MALAAELEDALVKPLVQAAPPEPAQEVESSLLNGPVAALLHRVSTENSV